MSKPLKQKKCRSCKELFTPFNSMHIACSPNCAIQLNKDKRVEAFNKETKELKAGLNRTDLKWQHKLTQKSFNKLRVLQEFKWFEDRGLEPECISCGKKNMDWCCGHLKTVGSAGRLRYDEKNTYLQCNRYCNMGLSGNINGNTTTRGYLNGLDDRFEPKGASVIKEYCEQNTHAKKWEWRELESMRESFNESIRNMDKP